MHVLIIEDDPELGTGLLGALKSEGITVVWLRSLQRGAQFADASIDCVLLDLTLPDGHGLELLRRWRQQHLAVPVLIITAQSSLQDRLDGLDAGADDYLIKPFAMAELISRLRALYRRSVRQASERWVFGDLVIEPKEHRVSLNGDIVQLSPREFSLLVELARHPERPVSKGALAGRLAPLGDPLDIATIEVHLSNLRRKLGSERIRTIRGVGYQLIV